MIIQAWRAVDPGQGCEGLVAGGTECAAGIVIPAADEDVGGLAVGGIFLARLSGLVLGVPGPRHDLPPGAPWLFNLPATSTGGAQTCFFNSLRNNTRRRRQWKTSGNRQRLGRSSALGEAAAAPLRHAVCAGILEREKTREGLQLP
ncbi:MAG: hypothetical protein M3178_07570 [Pseudomonadota bacterium]|nr:hypothetical protein [Pseudomonadota bacterium]